MSEPGSTPTSLDRLRAVRAHSVALAAPLSPEDCQAQAMPDASPVKWHLAHTTWFFETFVLERAERPHRPFDPAYRSLFNSYYESLGDARPPPRPERGLLTRPTLHEVLRWRADVDARLAEAYARIVDDPALAPLLEVGIQHEQQHQELLLTDVLALFDRHPLAPCYGADAACPPSLPRDVAEPLDVEGGLVEIGHRGGGFAFDNETPRHRVWLDPYAIDSQPVSQAQWLEFIDDGGYRDRRWWTSAGREWRDAEGIEAPGGWRRGGDGRWRVFSLRGLQDVDARQPVLHVSQHEATAYAAWAGARQRELLALPTEAQFEHACDVLGDRLHAAFGSAWQWTSSAYAPYPGYRPWEGSVGEYNGQFMSGTVVLRGSSFATPAGHARRTYRNFFAPTARWQFSGVRLARIG